MLLIPTFGPCLSNMQYLTCYSTLFLSFVTMYVSPVYRSLYHNQLFLRLLQLLCFHLDLKQSGQTSVRIALKRVTVIGVNPIILDTHRKFFALSTLSNVVKICIIPVVHSCVGHLQNFRITLRFSTLFTASFIISLLNSLISSVVV